MSRQRPEAGDVWRSRKSEALVEVTSVDTRRAHLANLNTGRISHSMLYTLAANYRYVCTVDDLPRAGETRVIR